MLNNDDRAYLRDIGIDDDTLNQQLKALAGQTPKLKLQRPCSIEDGVSVIPTDEHERLQRVFEDYAEAGRISTFIPAAGDSHNLLAALLAIPQNAEELSEARLNQAASEGSLEHIMALNILERLDEFALFDDLQAHLADQNIDARALIKDREFHQLTEALLSSSGLDLANLPRALFKFHRYETHSRTALEEHLVEAAILTGSDEGWVNVHLAVDEAHLGQVEKYVVDGLSQLQDKQPAGTRFSVHYSTQKSQTKSVALSSDMQLVRDNANQLQLLNGGHGTLLSNLNDIDDDLIMVKGLDNIAADQDRQKSLEYQKILGGYLIELRKRIRYYADRLRRNYIDESTLSHIIDFADTRLSIMLPENVAQGARTEKITYLLKILNRPIRVCGLIRDEIEYGGRPFWVENAEGAVSLQLVEPAEIDRRSRQQNEVWHSSTYLNPIWMICSTSDFDGKPLDLHEFADPARFFVNKRSYAGTEVAVFQQPGLWNGAMANWTTVFIELPGELYRPVKTMQDLLRTAHHPRKIILNSSAAAGADA